MPFSDDLKENVSATALCQEYLKAEIRKGPKAKFQDEYKLEAMALIPELSDRAFLHVWSNIVPDSWKKKGRPRLPENDAVS